METRRFVKRPRFFHEETIPGSRDVGRERRDIAKAYNDVFELHLKEDRDALRALQIEDTLRDLEAFEDRLIEELLSGKKRRLEDLRSVDAAILRVNAELKALDEDDDGSPWSGFLAGDADSVRNDIKRMCTADVM